MISPREGKIYYNASKVLVREGEASSFHQRKEIEGSPSPLGTGIERPFFFSEEDR